MTGAEHLSLLYTNERGKPRREGSIVVTGLAPVMQLIARTHFITNSFFLSLMRMECNRIRPLKMAFNAQTPEQ